MSLSRFNITAVNQININNNVMTVDSSGILRINGNPVGTNNSSNYPLVISKSGSSLTLDNHSIIGTDNFNLTATEISLNGTGLSVNGMQIKNLLEGTSDTDAVTKGYVDRSINTGCWTTTVNSCGINNPVPDSSNYQLSIFKNGNYLNIDSNTIYATGTLAIRSNNQIDMTTTKLHFTHPVNISNVATPIIASDVVIKQYCDNNVNKVPYTSGIMTVTAQSIGISNVDPDATGYLLSISTGGNYLNFNENTIYCTENLQFKVPLNRSINLFNQVNITNVKDPVNAQDVSTKNYVDNAISKISFFNSATLTLNSSDLTGLFASGGIVLVPGIIGKNIVPYSIEFYLKFNSIPYSFSGDFILESNILNTTGLLTTTGDKRLYINNGLIPNSTGEDLILEVTSAITNGDSPLKIRIQYTLIDPL